MEFSLIFDNSDEQIIFESLHDDLVKFYIDQLNELGVNSFSCFNSVDKTLTESLKSLSDLINEINSWPNEIKPPFFNEQISQQYFDQRVLNKLHANWAQSLEQLFDIRKIQKLYDTPLMAQIFDMFPDDIPTPSYANILQKLNLLNLYNELNTRLHKVEGLFDEIKYSNTWIEIPNPFGTNVVSDNIANISMWFHHLGRTYHNKWSNWDSDLEFQDENTFNYFLPCIDIKLQRAQTVPYTPEYLTWCTKQHIIPSGNIVCLGNIPDLEQNLTNYRIMIFENITAGNSFKLQY